MLSISLKEPKQIMLKSFQGLRYVYKFSSLNCCPKESYNNKALRCRAGGWVLSPPPRETRSVFRLWGGVLMLHFRPAFTTLRSMCTEG